MSYTEEESYPAMPFYQPRGGPANESAADGPTVSTTPLTGASDDGHRQHELHFPERQKAAPTAGRPAMQRAAAESHYFVQ